LLVRAYWDASEPAARAPIAGRISAHPDYRPARLRDWLHAGVPFDDLRAGTRTITVDAGAEGPRPVTLVLPEGYRSDRAWPLVYALHPSGEPAERWAAQVQRLLGDRAREFVIASPEYRQNYIAVRPPFAAEHAIILDAVARLVHVDANRVYGFGYSKGGFAAWYVTVYFADRFAGTVALAAGFDVAPGPDGFWRQLAPNVTHVPVLNAWGDRDPLIIRDLAEKPAGTFAESNRWFARELRGMGLPITNIEVPARSTTRCRRR
jgi:poly(3-hydroxybutyrate) depolymerase